jgi:hypothetical protein
MSGEQKILYSLLAGLAGALALYCLVSGDWAGLAVNALMLAILTALALLATFEERLGKTAQRAAILTLFLGFAAGLLVYEEGNWLKAGRFAAPILLISLFQVGFEWMRDRQRGHREVLENPDD